MLQNFLIILSSTSFFLTYYSKIILTAPYYSQIMFTELPYYAQIIPIMLQLFFLKVRFKYIHKIISVYEFEL